MYERAGGADRGGQRDGARRGVHASFVPVSLFLALAFSVSQARENFFYRIRNFHGQGSANNLVHSGVREGERGECVCPEREGGRTRGARPRCVCVCALSVRNLFLPPLARSLFLPFSRAPSLPPPFPRLSLSSRLLFTFSCKLQSMRLGRRAVEYVRVFVDISLARSSLPPPRPFSFLHLPLLVVFS